MDANTWKIIRRAAACVPLTMAATQPSLLAQQLANHGQHETGTWTFHHEYVLGTSLSVKVRAASFAQAQKAEAAALAEFDRQHKILSAWRKDSEFSRWSATRFKAVSVSPELFEVLAAFDGWREQTGGALNPSAEAAVRLWRQAYAEGRMPSEVELAKAAQAMARVHWSLSSADRTATRLTDVPLALASFAKSYVTQNAADAALRAGASGVLLNVGGDVVVRGALKQAIDIADPHAPAENNLPVDRVAVRDRAVATSGSYHRGVVSSSAPHLPRLSHIIDPRTARPAGHVLSSTVIAPDAATAGALATAFSVMSLAESANLAARTPQAEYLLLTENGRRIQSPGWSAYQAPGLRTAAYTVPSPMSPRPIDTSAWNSAYELTIKLELPRINDARARRPYVAAWIEDADHYPVRTLALWVQNPRWLPELKQWYRDDQIRNLSEGSDISRTVSSATRPAGQYSLQWDGKDNEGKPVKPGKYTLVLEASREHGGYQIERHELNLGGQPQQTTLPPGSELGAVTIDYHKR